MALLMVHLLVAQKWAQAHEEYLNCPEFYLGVIAPDAVYIRDGSDKSHKNEIHLNNWNEPDTDSVIAYWKEHHTPFDIGYGIHVLTDAQWAPHFRKCFPDILYPDGTVKTDIYYNDTFSTDYELYAQRGGAELFGLADRGVSPDGHPMLEKTHFEQWCRMMVDEYKEHQAPTEPVVFIDRAFVEKFIEDSQKLLNDTYGRYNNMNEVLKAIQDRRSTRGFSDVQLMDEQLQALVDAALASPTARNTQMWHFSFVQNKEVLDALRKHMADQLGKPEYDVFYNAPTVAFISRPVECANRFVDVDCGIACENIVLAAQGMGLGSVIIGMVMDAFLSDKGAEYAKAVGMPEGHRFSIAIALGNNTVTKEAHPIEDGKVTIVK